MATVTATQVDQAAGFATLYQWLGLTQAGADVGTFVYVGHLTNLVVGYVTTGGADTSVDFETSFDGVNPSGKLTPTGAATSATAFPNAALFIRAKNVLGAANVVNAFVKGTRFS